MSEQKKPKSLLDYDGEDYRRKMTKEETKCLMGAFSCEMAPDPKIDEMVAEDPMCRIVAFRVEKWANVEVSNSVLIWVCSLCGGRPGTGVMWSYTLAAIAEKRNKRTVSFEDWVEEFPFGVPTERAYRECWDSQKQQPGENATDNQLDTASNWQIDVP